MNPLIRSGLVGGAIGGEAMVLLVLVNTLLLKNFAQGNASQTQPVLVLAWGICYPLIVILIFETGGIFSSWLCRAHVHTGREALLPGIIAGVTIGIILEIMWIANIVSLAAHAAAGLPGRFMGQGDVLIVVILILVLIVMGAILSAFGSYIFSLRSIQAAGDYPAPGLQDNPPLIPGQDRRG
jgi:hypothetical protein